MDFTVSKEVIDLGMRVAIVVIKDMKNKKTDVDFQEYKMKVLNDIKESLNENSLINDSILKGFWKLHEKVGKTSKKDISSPENLLNMLLTDGEIPNINLIVDIYNLVSIQTRLALGAHDLNNIDGNVSLKLTDGSEFFLPIGYSKPKTISKGEYAYIDDNNDILCRMEVRQVEKTKVTEDTKSCMYIIQGNENASKEMMEAAIHLLVDETKKYCGGIAEIIYI